MINQISEIPNDKDLKKLWGEQLKTVASKIKCKQDLLEKELKQLPSTPQAGDIFIFKMPELTVGLQWVVLEADKKNSQLLLTVPADDAPMVGSTDVQLPDNALCSPLTLRCDQMLLIHKDKFDIYLRVGVLDEWHHLRALKKLKQISDNKFRIRLQRFIIIILKALHNQLPKIFYRLVGDITQLRSSVLHQAINYEPDYVDWIRQVSQERKMLRVKLKKISKSDSNHISITQKIKNFLHSLQKIYIPIPAIAFVLVLSVVTYIFWPLNPIDTTYQTIVAQKTDVIVEEWHEFTFIWEGETQNSFGFSQTGEASLATKVFSAGLLTARETLLENKEFSLPKPLQKNWAETEWVSYFNLGRWTVLLWTASQFPDDMPADFWEKQQKILAQFQTDFVKRQETDNDAKLVVSQLEKIQHFLDKLPTTEKPEIYDDLGFGLKDMMDFLATNKL